jgi:molecular chaperone HtpG
MSKTFHFEAETGRILELLTHSIYSNPEIFLRELISNASDALDKARIKSLTDDAYLWEERTLQIKIWTDVEKNILFLEDTGIGMTEEELHKNIGTIAKSGTKEFVEKFKKAKDAGENNLIGQFGVGFYSAFMVADKVELETKSVDSQTWFTWISDGKSEYEVLNSSKTTRWTLLKLFLNEANKELLSEWRIRELIKKYSNYVAYPIMLQVEKTPPQSSSNEGEASESKQGEWTKELVWEQVNETKPLWQKNKSEITKEDYKKFYEWLTYDFKDPLATIHFSTEWVVSYKSLLFVPEEKSMFANLADPNREYGPKLYVKNVLILDNAKDLLPIWLRFVSGVVETSDLPLNISREMLQSNPTLEKIRKNLTKKVLSELKKAMWENPSSYENFLKNYWVVLKEGIYYDKDVKQEVAEVLKFYSFLEKKYITLDEYIEKKKTEEGAKKQIFYITGKSQSEVLASPYLAQFEKANVDVLLLTDQVDDFIVQSLTEYKEYTLASITSTDIELTQETEEEKKQKEDLKRDFKDFLELTKNTIWSNKIEKVELNDKLGDAVGALKTPQWWMTPQMEKMYTAMWQALPPQKRILELNPRHEIVQMMKEEFTSDIKSDKLKNMMKYAYEQAILLEWWELENMGEFIKRVNLFLQK